MIGQRRVAGGSVIGRSQSGSVGGRVISRSQGWRIGGQLGHHGSVQEWSGRQDLGHRSHGLNDSAFAANYGIETMDRIGSVLHNATCAVGFDQGIGTLDNIAAARFLLALDIASGMIL